MNEIDFFLKLLDIKSATKILSMFQINTKSKNLNYIKVKLRKILKGQTTGTKNGDPFNFLILQYRNEDFESFNEDEFKQAMIEMDADNYPEYKKYLNYLSYFHEQAILNTDKLDENFSKDGKIFEKKLYLQSEDQVRSYIEKIEKNLNMDMYALESIIKVCLDREEIVLLDQANEKHKDSNLIEIYKDVIKAKNDKEKDILKLSYSLNNYDEDDKINKILRTEVIQAILIRKYKDLKELDIERKGNTENSKKYKEKNIKLKEENKTLSDKLKSINKNLKQKEQENKDLIQKLKGIKNTGKKEIEKLELAHEKDMSRLENKEKFILEKFKAEEKIDIAFIISNKYKLVDKIFPEVSIIKRDDFNSSKADILKMKVRKIYIQRQEMNSNEINLLEKKSRELGIRVNLLQSKTEKELIEDISYIKKEEVL